MNYLVDANVLSEVTKPKPDPKIIAWIGANEVEIAVDGTILGEIHYGILLLPKSRRRQRLEEWFQSVVTGITCLPWEAETGLEWAKLLARLRKSGRSLPIKNSLIAATALQHDLTLVTRNTRDFGKTGVKLLNPFL